MTGRCECLQISCFDKATKQQTTNEHFVIHLAQIWRTTAVLLASRSSIASKAKVPMTVRFLIVSMKID